MKISREWPCHDKSKADDTGLSGHMVPFSCVSVWEGKVKGINRSELLNLVLAILQ